MKKGVLVSLCILVISSHIQAETISGRVIDGLTREPLIGVTITDKAQPTIGTVTDFDGNYSIEIPNVKGTVLTFSYIGYDTEVRHLTPGINKLNLYMMQHNEVLDEVVVSVGRFEQRQTDVTVSMEVVKPQMLRAQAPTDLSATLQTLPGVDIVDKQPNIRGGGGWTYSVGSRCLVMMDGMSILNPKTGEVNWNNIPIENVGQVEVIKGASSVLYGSSALNGIINVRTQRPGLKPETKASIYTGIYDNYKNYYYTGSRLPIYVGAEASHSRRVGDFDITASINLFKDEGYREQSFNNRLRFGGSFTWHKPMPAGKYMSMGANTNYIGSEYGDFFIWRSPKQPHKTSPLSNMGRREHNFNIDPFFNYDNTNNGISHKVRARFAVTADNLTRPTEAPDLVTLGKNLLPKLNMDTVQSWAGKLTSKPIDVSFMQGLLDRIYDASHELNDLITGEPVDWIDVIKEAKALADQVAPRATTNDLNDIIGVAMDVLADKEPTRPELTYNYYVDYQFSKSWKSGVRLTAGATWNHITNTANITGTHQSDNAAVYLQYDHRIVDRLSLCLGTRFEYYRIDDSYKEATIKLGDWTCPVRPVFRAGLNWEIYKAGFLRASFGQGYRNPSITEKFARKDIGGIGVYPNHNVQAESGFSAELGYKQLYRIGKLSGYMDISGFYMEYRDMIEYQFGLFNNVTYEPVTSIKQVNKMVAPIIDAVMMNTGIIDALQQSDLIKGGIGIGAQFVNVSHARIYGAELSTGGRFDIDKSHSLNYLFGYTFTMPEDMDNDKRIEEEKTYTDPLMMKNKSNDSKYLKYRNLHSVKVTLDYNYKWFSVGANMQYKSKILAVDYLLVDEREKAEPELMDYVRTIIFGKEDGVTLHDYWEKHNKGHFVLDLRFAARIKEHWELQFMINNLLNTEYSTRPMALGAPRNYVCRLNYTF